MIKTFDNSQQSDFCHDLEELSDKLFIEISLQWCKTEHKDAFELLMNLESFGLQASLRSKTVLG